MATDFISNIFVCDKLEGNHTFAYYAKYKNLLLMFSY